MPGTADPPEPRPVGAGDARPRVRGSPRGSARPASLPVRGFPFDRQLPQLEPERIVLPAHEPGVQPFTAWRSETASSSRCVSVDTSSAASSSFRSDRPAASRFLLRRGPTHWPSRTRSVRRSAAPGSLRPARRRRERNAPVTDLLPPGGDRRVLRTLGALRPGVRTHHRARPGSGHGRRRGNRDASRRMTGQAQIGARDSTRPVARFGGRRSEPHDGRRKRDRLDPEAARRRVPGVPLLSQRNLMYEPEASSSC